MKLSLLLTLVITLIYSCSTPDKKSKSNANELIYKSTNITSGALSAELQLSGYPSHQEMVSQLKLTNSASKTIDIQEIVIATNEGLRSLPEAGNIEAFSLKPNKDTTLSLKFRPLNDLKLFKLTGMQGGFKPAYTVLISYKVTGNDDLITLAAKSTADKDEYLDYSRKHKKPVISYSFNTKNGFNEKQKKYLETLKQVSQPPFVYLSEQEIAISGLNFRLKSHFQQDTLHAELFVVNHADFPVKIIPDALDIVANGKPGPGGTKTITIEKISGSQQDAAMMEKGDRVLIHFKKFIKIKTPESENLTLCLTKAFILTGRKALFNEDVKLLPVSNNVNL